MDDKTKHALDDFFSFLMAELVHQKDLKHLNLEVVKYSVHDIKVNVVLTVNKTTQHIYFDMREITENQPHFEHLLGSAIDQIKQLSGVKSI